MDGCRQHAVSIQSSLCALGSQVSLRLRAFHALRTKFVPASTRLYRGDSFALDGSPVRVSSFYCQALDQSQQAAQPAAEVARSKKDKKRQIGDENAAADPDAAAFAFFDSVQGLGLPAKGAPKTVEEMQRTYVSPDNWDIEHPYNKDGYKVRNFSSLRGAMR